ncbi:MAG TPA: HAD-IA family hydrolase [Usitatibacter sp.]|nr:HAD-IA family hydrolase [Usitatibacter sp.]
MDAEGRDELNSPQVLLFDFGGVLIEIDFERVFARWAELAGVPVAQVKQRFDHGEAYQQHERGEIDAAAYFAALRARLEIDLTDADFVDGWQQVFGAEIAPTVALLPRLAPRIPIHLFSNTNALHYDYWSKHYARALEPVERRFISCQMGVRKPERESFARVARELGVAPERILFFDDTLANVEGARAAGVPTVWVRSPADVESAVAPWLQ